MRPGAIRPNPGTPLPRADRPAPTPAAPPTRSSFRKTILWVALAHLVLLAIVGFCRFPAKAPASGQVMEFIALPSQQVSPTPPVSGSASQAPIPSAAAPPAPTPVAPRPPTPVTPPTPVEPTPTPPTPPVAETEPPTPAPVPVAPSEIVIPQKPTPPAPETPAKTEKKKKKKAKTPAAAAPDDTDDDTTPAKSAPHVPKVNLQEVDRSTAAPSAAKGVAEGKGTKPNESKSAEGEGNGLTPSGVKDELSKSLNSLGLDSHLVGPASGGGGGPAGTADQWYYDLIRQAMYGAWTQPSELAGEHLNTKIKIHIAADGTVSDPSIAVSSGNAAYDASALDAARSVTHLSKPRPDAIPESVNVNFQLME